MPKDTPSMAKNKIRRSLVSIYDPPPSKKQIDELWYYFDSKCVYCDNHIDRESRTGHLDHMLAASEGGSNSIHNFALSCAKCNGDDKREEDWHTFLKRTAPSEDSYQKSVETINQWLAKAENVVTSPEFIESADQIIADALHNFDQAVKKMRDLRDQSV